jgi:hypothetical protein
MLKKTILRLLFISLFGAWADIRGVAADASTPAAPPPRRADDLDIYLNMGGLKPLDQLSFTLDTDDLKLSVPPEAFGIVRDVMDRAFLRMSVHLVANGRHVRSAPVTPMQKIPLQTRQITGTNSDCCLVMSAPLILEFSGRQVYDAIKAMDTAYGAGVVTVLVPEVLQAQQAVLETGRKPRQEDQPNIVFVPVPAGTNAPQFSILTFNTNKLKKVTSAAPIQERELALYVKQEAAAAALEDWRKDLESRLAAEAAARKAGEERLAGRLEQESKERQAALQKIEAQLLALGTALSNFTGVEFKKFSEEFAFKFQWAAQAVSNLNGSVSVLTTNLALSSQKVNAIGTAVDKLNGRSGWGNVFKSSETTTLGK